MTQFSLFGAEAAPPRLDDLEGLLVAGGQWVRSGPAARLSVVVADEWRARALAAAFDERGVGGPDAIVAAATGFGARTAFTPELVAVAARWTRGANHVAPTDFVLAVGGLRIWAIAAGRRTDAGYLLASASDDSVHQAAGAALARLGVAAVALPQRGGPGWRVTSGRRLRRLAELVGPAPPGASSDWPDLVRA